MLYAALLIALVILLMSLLIVYVGGRHRTEIIYPKRGTYETSKTIDLKVPPKTKKINDSGLRNKIYHAKIRRKQYVEHNGEVYETGYTGSDAR